jgi:hypothetical protein
MTRWIKAWLATAAAFTAAQATAQTKMLIDQNDQNLSNLLNRAPLAMGVGSVADAQARAGAAPQNRMLILVGHGRSGLIGVGSGLSNNYVNGRDLQHDRLNDVQVRLLAIRQSFLAPGNPNANVLLLCGCNSGDGDDGRALVDGLSGIVRDVYVVAATAPTSTGFYVSGQICARVMGERNPGPWTSRNSVISLNGGLVTDRNTVTRVLGLVNGGACVPCAQASQCRVPTSAASNSATCAQVSRARSRSARVARRRGRPLPGA